MRGPRKTPAERKRKARRAGKGRASGRVARKGRARAPASDATVEQKIARSRSRLARLRELADGESAGRASPFHDALGELERALEELSAANEELAEAHTASEQHALRYQDLFHHAPDGYVVTDADGVIRELNSVAAQQLGLAAPSLKGVPLRLRVAKSDRDAFGQCLSLLRARKGRIANRRLRFGADPGFDASVSAVAQLRGHEPEIRWMLRDASELRMAELRASQERFKSEAAALARLNDASSRLWHTRELSSGLDEMLAATIGLLNADIGNIQLLDAERGVLVVAAQRGFGREFLDRFREVSPADDAACGRALRSGQRIVIEDVERDAAYAPLRAIARAAGYRAVQSTPLVGRDGLLGMISTYFRMPHRPSEVELRRLDLYARLAADYIERQRSDQTLHDRESRLRTLAHSMRVLIAYYGRDQRYRFSNAAYERWFGIPAEKVVGMHKREVLGEKAYAKLRPRIERVLAGEPQLFEETLAYARGGTRDVVVEYEPDLRAGGEMAGFFSLVVDVSALKSAERDAREAEERIRSVVDAAFDGILSADEKGRIRSANPALARMFGYATGDALVGVEVAALLKLPGRQRARLSLPVVTGSVRELVGVQRDGTRFDVQVSVGAVPLQAGKTFVATVRDLRSQRTLESRLRAAAQAAVLAEERERRRLAADLHDDVSQLLSLAGMKLGMLRGSAGDKGLDGSLLELSELLTRARERTESLTFQLSPPVLHDVGLAAAVEWLAEEIGRSYGLRVRLECEGELPLDERMRITLFRALRELLINVARHANTHEARVALRRDGDYVAATVQDHGLGFDRAQVRTGFGLLNIRERIEALGGRFELDTELGRGTRAVMLVPARAASSQDP